MNELRDIPNKEDARREKALREMGLRIVRFRNDEVVKNVSAVVGKISKFIIHNSSFIIALPAGKGFT